MTNCPYACNSSTNFKYITYPPATKKNINFLGKTRKITLKLNYFVVGFCYLEPLCVVAPLPPHCAEDK